MTPTLIVPGNMHPHPAHWQSLWEDLLEGARRVEMPSWEFPRRAEWVEALDEAIVSCEDPPLLVGYGLGCLAIVHWAATHTKTVRGALLVAPEDVERPETPEALRTFAPVPRQSLEFSAILAASSTDPHVSLERARGMATDWGTQFVDLGPCGHLDVESGHGPWLLGESLLAELR